MLKRLRHLFLASAFAIASNSVVAEEFRAQLPDGAFVYLDLPAGWVARSQITGPSSAPTVEMVGDAVYLGITTLWPANPQFTGPDLPNLRGFVENQARRAKAFSTETELAPIELSGGSVVGYYYFATERAPKADTQEYKAQGIAVAKDGLQIVFTILFRGEPTENKKTALAVIQSIRKSP